jgi:hypothetical protein
MDGKIYTESSNEYTYLFTERINECQEITTVGLAFGDFCTSSVPQDDLSRFFGCVNGNLQNLVEECIVGAVLGGCRRGGHFLDRSNKRAN